MDNTFIRMWNNVFYLGIFLCFRQGKNSVEGCMAEALAKLSKLKDVESPKVSSVLWRTFV